MKQSEFVEQIGGIFERGGDTKHALWDFTDNLAQAGKLTETSINQRSLPCEQVLCSGEQEIFTISNNSYVEKFGFLFNKASEDNTKQMLIFAFKNRLKNDGDTEFNEAFAPVERSARRRLKGFVGLNG